MIFETRQWFARRAGSRSPTLKLVVEALSGTHRRKGTSACLMLLALISCSAVGHSAGDSRWTDISPQGGFVTVLKFPYRGEGTALAGLWRGGLWVSDDFGWSWTKAGSRGGPPSVTAIATCSQMKGTIFANGGGNVVYKTTDWGADWTSANLPEADRIVGLALDSADLRILYAASTLVTGEGRIYRSTDGGASFTDLASWPSRTSITALAAGMERSGTVYAAAYSLDIRRATVLKSTDGGKSWATLGNALGGSYNEVWELQEDPWVLGLLYATSASGLYISRDRGASWTLAGEGLPRSRLSNVAISLDVPGVVYVTAYSGTYASVDFGRTWTRLEGKTLGTPVTVAVSGRSSSPTILVGTDGSGVYSYDLENSTWVNSSLRLRGSRINSVAADPTDPSVLYAGGIGCIWKSVDGGKGWQAIFGADSIYQLAIDPTTPSTVYGVGFGIWKTTDSGSTWTNLPSGGIPPLPLSRVLLISRSDSRVMFSSSLDWVLKSVDAGITWTPFPMGLRGRLPFDLLGSIALDAAAPDVLYGSKYGVGFYRSVDGGETWTLRPSEGLAERNINAFAVDPAHNHELFAATYDGVYRTQDEGKTWALSGLDNRDVSAVQISATTPGIVYAGTYSGGRGEGGVFRSRDRGATWQSASEGLPEAHRDIWQIVPLTSDPGRVIIVSFEGGVFEGHGLDVP